MVIRKLTNINLIVCKRVMNIIKVNLIHFLLVLDRIRRNMLLRFRKKQKLCIWPDLIYGKRYKTMNVKVLQFFLLIIFVMGSCAEKTPVDLILTGGVIYTVDKKFSKEEALAVHQGKIVATGTKKEITGKYKPDSLVNASDKCIFPGFNDAHCHFNGYGINLIQYADLRGTGSPEEICLRLKEHHKRFGGEWILGRNWDQNDWMEKEFPDKKILDSFFPENPVYLVRVDGHAGWCNSIALHISDIQENTVVPGGEVVLKDGKPSGILIDNAMGIVGRKIPELSPTQKNNALLAAQEKCFAAGLTSVTDCGLDKDEILRMQDLQKEGKLKIRINAMLNPSEENMRDFVVNGTYRSERMVINTIKLFADGALGSRGALFFDDYNDDPGNRGLQLAPWSYFEQVCEKALVHGFAVATHCIGDSANRLMLDIYSKILKGPNDRRWRIEHAQVIHPGDFTTFAEYSIVPSIQSTHATSDMPWAQVRIGKDRITGAYAYRTLLNQLGWLPNGTDFPVEDINPLFTFFSSVFRTDHNGFPEGGWFPSEKLDRESTLRSMTIWAAKASFEENEKGSLEPGKWADFVILDTDLMKATPEEILKARVESTWIAGEKVFGQ